MMLKNNLALAYVLLIGLPILTLFGVLQSGTGLTAVGRGGGAKQRRGQHCLPPL